MEGFSRRTKEKERWNASFVREKETADVLLRNLRKRRGISMWEYHGRKWELDLEEYETALRYQRALETMAGEERRLKEGLASGDAAFQGPEGIRMYVEMIRRFFAGLLGQEAVEALFEGRCNVRECDEAYLSLMEYLRGQVEEARARKERFLAYLPRGAGQASPVIGRSEGPRS